MLLIINMGFGKHGKFPIAFSVSLSAFESESFNQLLIPKVSVKF